MYKQVKELFSLLTENQRKRFYRLQVLVIVMSFFELIGIASIAPFMALVGDIDLIETNSSLNKIYQISGVENSYNFLFLTGLMVLFTLTLSTVVSMLTIWRLALFSVQTGTEIADRLYKHYMNQSWLFHANNSSAQLTKQISTEAVRITDGVIQPLMSMNSKIILAIFISVGVFLFNPIPALVGVTLFVSAYIILYKFVQLRLKDNGSLISHIATERFRLMNEGFGGIKDVLLLGRNHDFISRFKSSGVRFSYAQGTNTALSLVPRYFMELLAFGSMITIILILIKTSDGNLGIILPVLSIYALAGFKLLPALQQIYSNLTALRGNIAAFESIKLDMLESRINSKSQTTLSSVSSDQLLIVSESIQLKNVTFTYLGKHEPSLKDLSLKITANQVIGIVGPSGSGKSTIIDVLLGLVLPQKGELLIDDILVDDSNRRAWQNTIGFVPQSIFLSEGSIAENVAFGITACDIDRNQVFQALKLSHLEGLVDSLEYGIDTKVGERGVQLSGGQRQRIGIARALYHKASVLVFDEATSALDGITEKLIMEAIHDFSGKKTIIMIAHRLKTVEKCDIIFYVDKGRVLDKGTYQDLLNSNSDFRDMALHA